MLYYFEIQGLYNNPKAYYHLNSERSIICDTGEDLYCHAILYINRNYNNNKNLLYVYPYIGTDNITIYAKYYSNIEETSYHKSIEQLFPSDKYNDYKSKGKNHIFLNSKKFIDENVDMNILLTIYSEAKNNKIKLISDSIDTSKTLLPYGTEKLFYFTRDIKFHLPFDNSKNNNFYLNIQSIKGTQQFTLNDENIISDFNGNYYIELTANPSGKSFELVNINKEEKEQGILINYYKAKEDKLFKLEKNIKNEIFLVLSEDKSLPQYAYTKLVPNLSSKAEIFLHDIIYAQNSNSDDLFKINGYIITKDVLNKRISNPDTKIEGEEIQGKYIIYEKTGIIELTEDKIKLDNEYYLYIKIDKDASNTNIYRSIKVQYAVNERGIVKIMKIYPNKFYYSEINNVNKEDYYLIYKQSSQDNYIIIDIAEKIPVLNNLEIKKELFKEINKDVLTEDLIQEFVYNGRKRIIAKIIDYDGIKLYIKKKNEDENTNKYYSINFNLVNNLSSFENFTNFINSLSISENSQNKNKTNLIFNNILRYKRGFAVKNLIYYIDIFEVKEEIKQKTDIYSTYIGNHDEKNIKYSTILNNNRFFNSNLSLEINMTKEELKNCYIRVLADIFNNDGTRQKYIYSMTLVDIDKKEENKEVDTHSDIVSLVVFITIPTILIIVVVIVIVIFKKKKNKDPNPEDIESDSLIPE